MVSALRPRFVVPYDQDAGLILEKFPHHIAAEIPSLSDFGHGIVALLKAHQRRFLGALAVCAA